MGDLSRLPLAELVREHRIDTVVETGTGHGFSIAAALAIPALTDIHSVEIDAETWERERKKFDRDARARDRLHLYCGDSVHAIPVIIGQMEATDRRVLWFLDAHFPGSGRARPIPMIVTPYAVPVAREIRVLLTLRDVSRDVIVVDDLCMFEPGDYESDASAMREKLPPGMLAQLTTELRNTHTFTRLTKDGGYLIAAPCAT